LIYAATTYWYAFPGGSVAADVKGATAVIPTLAEAQAPPPAFPGVIDAEGLKISAASAGLVHEAQDMEGFGAGVWSGGRQLLGKAVKEGDFVTVEIPVQDGAAHRLLLAATQAPDFGVLAFAVNGQDSAVKFDGYAGSVIHAAEVDLGTFTPVDGKYVVKVQVSGANPASGGARYYFGIDYFKLGAP
ncbi:MAG: hypothetical protein JWO82_3464, partial [Akkermansiaceae bacterium]|nr:hypothetical protein [Akkermansiaceae bacterium]